MTKFASISLLIYYLFGALYLPGGDFSTLSDLPEMYRHCKAMEDKDMTPLDFITDHLLNIDCLFDDHANGDDQKPHAPIQFHHQQSLNIFITQRNSITIDKISLVDNHLPVNNESIYSTDYFSEIFRPPIV